jgi:transcriptional regulator with XRE-family HTH domain
LLDNHKIGINILQLRKRKSLTQTELSKRLGVSHQAVSKWEHGECLPDIEVLLQLGRIFGKSVEEILLFERELDDAATETPTPLWDTALAEIKKRLSKPSFDTWFKHTEGELVDGVLCVYSPNNFATEWLYTRYAKFILAILNELTDEPDLIVEFRSRDSSSKGPDLISPNRARLSLLSGG